MITKSRTLRRPTHIPGSHPGQEQARLTQILALSPVGGRDYDRHDQGRWRASTCSGYHPETPVGMDRRAFLMRHAAIGAAAAMTGTTWSPEARAQQAATEAVAQRAAKEAAKDACRPQDERHPFARPRRRQEVQGAGDDPGGRVLQGGPRSLELAHHRADADHLRFLSALHEAAGRSTGAGDGPQGASVRQPERHRQGPWHRARLARRPRGQGAGHRGPLVPR